MSAQRGRQAFGALGEELAARHLESLGFRIIAQNHRCRRGEVDLIAEKGELLVFAEVRAKASARFGSPEETVDRRKQQRIILAARDFLARASLGERAIRFDVIGILDTHPDLPPTLRHLPGAFDAEF